MHVGLVIIAAAAIASASLVAAEPAKAPAKEAAQPVNHPAPVILASADHIPSPTAGDPGAAPQPKPHRVARVTTCRCGGQTEEQPEQ